jgi:O-methyltransferase involved in polyketide biosynthesis
MTSSDDWRRAATAEQMRSVVRTIDPSVAHIARIQDYWLGGKDHFEADRIAGDEAIAQLPDMVASVRNTRAFLGRTVRFLAAERGIRQFLDVGTGIPTASNTHEVAQGIAPESRIVYVDNDPMVLAHARALLTSSDEGRCAYIDADIRTPEKILAAAADLIDFSKPVAVVLMAVLQFVPDEDGPYELVRRLMAAVPAGSYLVISHPAADIQAAAMAGMATRLNQLMAQRVKPRTKDEVTTFFDGLSLVDPGVIRCPEWRPDNPEDAAGKSTMWGGVAEKADQEAEN